MIDKDVEFNYKYLDTLKLPKPMHREDVYDYMERVESGVDKKSLPPELKGCLFNFLDEADMSEYIKKRFKVNVYEDVHINYVIE